jgi:hypothetical protein
MSRLGNAQAIMRSACKDAAVQTDATLGAEDDLPTRQPSNQDKAQMAVNSAFEYEKHCANAPSLKKGGQKAAESPVLRVSEDLAASGPGSSEYVQHAQPAVRWQQLGGGTGRDELGGSFAAPGWSFWGEAIHDIDPSTYTHKAARSGCGPGSGRGSHPDLQVPLEEPLSCTTGHQYPSESVHGTDVVCGGGAVHGDCGFENLEDFIRRIEGEAAMLDEQLGVSQVLSHCGYGGLDDSAPRLPAWPDAVCHEAADDTHTMLSRGRMPKEAELPAPVTAEASRSCPQGVSFASSRTLEGLESHILGDQDGYLASLWNQRDLM